MLIVCKALATALVPLQTVADSAYNRAQFTASATGLMISVAMDVAIVVWLWKRVRTDAPNDVRTENPQPVDWLRTAALVLICAIAGIVLLAMLATAIGIAVPAYQRAQAATVVHPGGDSAISGSPKLTEGRVTIVSIAEHPAPGSKPWSMTGVLASEGPFKNEGSRAYPGPNEKAREIVFQIEDIPADASMTYKLNPASGWAGGQLQKLPPPSTAYYSLIAASFPKDLARATISVGIAFGEWQTIAEQSSNTTEMLSTNKNGHSYSVSFLKPVAQADGTFVLTVSHNAMDQQARVVAVDQADREYSCSQQSGRNADTFSQFTATFSSVPLEQVKAVRFQVRPYSWKTFEDVPLDPQASIH